MPYLSLKSVASLRLNMKGKELPSMPLCFLKINKYFVLWQWAWLLVWGSDIAKPMKKHKKRCGGPHKKNKIPIHHRPQLPTLIPTIHVPIVMHMNKMPIIALHFIWNYNTTNHGTPMLVGAKVLGKARRGKMWPTNVQPPSQLKANPTPWRLGLHG
jgi:hypothetical protein